MANVYRYVIVTDAGTAPHVDGDLASLCICKPKIRSSAKKGDYVIAFLSTRFGLGSGNLSWIGKVDQKLLLGDYHIAFRQRADAIYRRIGWSADGEELEHIGGDLHADRANQQRDKRGKYALTMRPFWYWGDGHAPLSLPAELAHLVYGSAGHASATAPTDIPLLESWLLTQPPGKHGRYRSPSVSCILLPPHDPDPQSSGDKFLRRAGCG